MFTGIIEELGKVKTIEVTSFGHRYEISAKKILDNLSHGSSISVNGCCLTCVEIAEETFFVEVVTETLLKTCFNDLKAGDSVNLERSLKVGSRLDGHIVSGHVDAVGTLLLRDCISEDSYHVTITAPAQVMRYLIEKGSITVDGVSLTAWNVTSENFTFAMIPFTANHTTLGSKDIGAKVNLEIDLIAKYVEKLSLPKQEI